MPIYLPAYHGSRIPTADERSELSSAWKGWMDQLGDALEGSNNPMKITKTVSADGSVSAGGGANPVVGLSFITVDDMDAAIRKTCEDMPPARRGGLDRSRRAYSKSTA